LSERIGRMSRLKAIGFAADAAETDAKNSPLASEHAVTAATRRRSAAGC
jgi:hypothetical protein